MFVLLVDDGVLGLVLFAARHPARYRPLRKVPGALPVAMTWSPAFLPTNSTSLRRS
jgi:hypothetical protein